MTAETKLRTLAEADPTLQSFFGSNPFRWFHIQLPPGLQPKAGATCARIRQVSQVPIYCQEGQNRLNQVRFQIDVLDPNVDTVDAATAAIAAWLGTVNLCSDAQFQSPAGVPTQFPNFVLNVRPGLEVQLKPPIPVNSIDVKVFNLDLI
jgi:hypothetical protein